MIRTLLLATMTGILLLTHPEASVAAEALMIVRHPVADYAKWRPVYDGNEDKRQAAGLTNGRIFQVDGNPNEVVILLDAADLEKAKTFASSEDLRAGMMKAGVTGKPEILFLTTAP
jgi:hypothetical protein